MDFDLDSVKRFLEFLYTGDYHEIPDPALALITTTPTSARNEIIQRATVQQNIGQAIVSYNGEDDQNGPAETSALANQLGWLTLGVGIGAAESWACHCRMSSIADYYDVARLSEIALAKLEESFQRAWCAPSFHALVSDCLNDISNRDTLALLGSIAAQHYSELAGCNLFRAGAPGEALAPYVLAGVIEVLDETEARCERSEDYCTELSLALERKDSELNQRSTNLKECESLLEDWSCCRNNNCNAEFNCYFDTKGPSESPRKMDFG
ncbi:hypothetical protein F4808DRAFT_455309 [Astrocystis sublimbata]|nr:hypothetical protein F4808DRAFT_455309 [Astrocystis sublimbata]